MTNTLVGGRQAVGGAVMTGVNTGTAGRVRNSTRSKRASRNLFLTVTAIIAAVFVLVGLSAYAASIQHANNVLTQENEYLPAEVESPTSQIIEETKVTKLEKVATKEYGMVYPTSDNCIVINEDEESSTNLAASIRSEAYK